MNGRRCRLGNRAMQSVLEMRQMEQMQVAHGVAGAKFGTWNFKIQTCSYKTVTPFLILGGGKDFVLVAADSRNLCC